jgi:soluble lytic murein transglycosylase-like protein
VTWLERLRGRVGRRETAAGKRVRAAIEARAEAASTAAWLDAIRAACADGDASGLALVAAEVPTEADPEDTAAVLAFWRELAATFAEPWLRLRRAEAELAAGDPRVALDLYLAACEASTDLALDEVDRVGPLADAAGGEHLFRWQLALLIAYLDHIPDDEDWIRERYSELLDAYRDQPERLTRLYELGARIRAMEATGELPQAMVVRPNRRPRSE